MNEDETIQATPEFQRASLKADLKALTEAGVITWPEILEFAATECGLGLTPEEQALADEEACTSDEAEIDPHPIASRADDGFWSSGWIWTPYPTCKVCDDVNLGECATEENRGMCAACLKETLDDEAAGDEENLDDPA